MKSLFRFSLLLISMFWFVASAYSSWTEYEDVRYLDLDGDLTDEIIIESKHGAGIGHYIEEMRIFKDEYPHLRLIFEIRTLDEYSLELPYCYATVSEVKFTEQTLENKGVREIIVKPRKIYYKDCKNKVVDKEEKLETKEFKWDGKNFIGRK